MKKKKRAKGWPFVSAAAYTNSALQAGTVVNVWWWNWEGSQYGVRTRELMVNQSLNTTVD